MKNKIIKFLKAVIAPFVWMVFGIRVLFAKSAAKKYLFNPPEKAEMSKSAELRHQKIMKIINCVLFLRNIQIDVLNLEKVPKVPVLFLMNHKSKLDALVIYKIIYNNPKYPLVCFVAKKELFYEKNGTILDLIDTVPIDRKNPRQALKALEDHAVQILKNQRSLCIFPESTRVPGDKLGEFSPGATIPAYKAFAPIVPVAIYNSEGQLKDVDSESRKFKKPKSSRVIINFGNAFKPHNFINLNNHKCAETVKKEVQRLYDEAASEFKKTENPTNSDHQEIMDELKSKFVKKKKK